MNFKKVMVLFVPLAALFVGYLYFTRLDHTDPIAVATAFTKALKANNISSASSYVLPDKAAAWRTGANDTLDKLKSGSMAALFEGIPATPGFTSINPKSPPGTLSLQSADKTFNLEMTQLTGKWYVSKAPL